MKPVMESAGSIIMEYKPENKQVEYKGSVDLITIADKRSEDFLFHSLQELFPEDSILAEEGHESKGTSGNTWIIDPLDGTTSYAHGFPFFCVSVGLVDANNEPLVGLVYAPMLREFFYATKGGGAYLNGKKIQVSNALHLRESLAATGFPYYRRDVMERLLGRLGTFLHEVHDVRRTGSAALDISYVACGRLDFYFEEGLKAWDVAAATLILQEAGGELSKFNGDTFDIFYPEVIASNSHVHKEAVGIMKKTI